MESIKKKGNTIKKLATVMWFVFCALSFLFLFNIKADAKTTYKYTFDLGGGSDVLSGGTTISDIKLVLTVEEDDSMSPSNPDRYTVIDRELTGYSNICVEATNVEGYEVPNTYAQQFLGFDLNSAPEQTIYHTMCFAAVAGTNGRKLMKSILFSLVENGGEIKVKENGSRYYVVLDTAAGGGNEFSTDSNFSHFKWLYDRTLTDRDFLGYFNKRSTNGYQAYNPKYAKDKMGIVFGNGGEGDLASFLNCDKNILCTINCSIEDKTAVGNYLKSIKKVYKTDEADDNETYCWWYQEGSYNENDNSIKVDCGPTKGDTKFTFKYTRSGSDICAINVGKLCKNSDGNFEYKISLLDADQNEYSILPDYTGGTFKKVGNYLSNNGGKVSFIVDEFHTAIDSVSTEGRSDGYIRVAKYKKANQTDYTARGKRVVSVPKKELDKIMDELGDDFDTTGLKIKKDRGYVFALDPSDYTIAFYKENDDSYTGMNMLFKNFYGLYYDDGGKQYGISPKADPRGRDKKSHKKIDDVVEGSPQGRFPTLRSNKQVINEAGENFDYSWSSNERFKALLYCLVSDPDFDCFLSVYDIGSLPVDVRGKTDHSIINRGDITLIAEVSVRDWLLEEFEAECDKIRERLDMSKNPGIGGFVRSNAVMRKSLKEFLETIVGYLKPIFMFLVFLSLVIAALFSIADSSNAEKRALIKIRVKNILLGCVAFACCIFIISLSAHFFDEAAKNLNQQENSFTYNISGQYDEEDNWFINVIAHFLDAISSAVEWLVDFIGTRLLLLDDRKLDIADAVFGVDEAGGISLYPYNELEWQIYMYGYKLLSAIFICLVAFALIKNAVEVIIGAGNSESQEAAKQDYLRAIVAVLCVVLVPYAFRLLLLLVNSLVKLVPVSQNKFTLEFDGYGFMGSIARIYFCTLKLKIYAIFAVRKVMMAFMLLSTPVVFGIWTFSKRFRSFDLWLGELTTNALMQIGYAFVFFFLVVISSVESNPFAILLLIGMIMSLADLVRNSIQGIFTEWGGINEARAAEQALDMSKKIGKTIVNEANTVKVGTGRFMQKSSKFIDKNGVTTGGFIAHTAGGIISGDYRRALLSGNFGAIRTKKDLAAARRKLVGDEYMTKKNEADSLKARLNLNDKQIRDLYDKYMTGTLTKEDIDELSHGEGKDFNTLKDFISAQGEATHLKQTYDNLEKTVNETTGILSSMQDSGTQKMLDKYISTFSSSPVASMYDDFKKDYKKKVTDMQETYRDFARGDLPPDLQEEKKKHLEEVTQQIVDAGVCMSQLAVDIDLDISDIDIQGGNKQALKILSKDLGTYDFENVEKNERLKDNLTKFNKAHKKK